jgi:hypothetical protein
VLAFDLSTRLDDFRFWHYLPSFGGPSASLHVPSRGRAVCTSNTSTDVRRKRRPRAKGCNARSMRSAQLRPRPPDPSVRGTAELDALFLWLETSLVLFRSRVERYLHRASLQLSRKFICETINRGFVYERRETSALDVCSSAQDIHSATDNDAGGLCPRSAQLSVG